MSSRKTNALELLSTYDSQEESSDEKGSPGSPQPTEICKRLPLPPQLYSVSTNTLQMNPELHDMRKRSFPHERGHWATHIFIPYVRTTLLEDLCDMVLSFYSSDIELKIIEEPHISLTKTFVIYHHWIDQLINTLKEGLKSLSSFHLQLNEPSVYCNEEKTRTFLSFDVDVGTTELKQSLDILQKCLQEYKLDPFYEVPSFHVSIAWCLGDMKTLMEERLPELKIILREFIKSNLYELAMFVDSYYCKTGNREYKFPLVNFSSKRS